MIAGVDTQPASFLGGEGAPARAKVLPGPADAY